MNELALAQATAKHGNTTLDVFPQDKYDHAGEGDRLIDLRELWAIIYRSRYWILGIMAHAIAAGVAITLLMTPRYSADTAVQIDQEAMKVLGTEQSESSASIQDAERFLKTQVDVITSRATARAVAEELRLFDGTQFFEQMNEADDVEATPAVSIADARRERVLEIVRDNLVVSLPPESRVVRIEFTSPDPALAARVANSYAENYIRGNLQRRFESSVYARDFLRTQLDEAQARLSRAEREAIAYARRSRIIDASNAAASAGAQPSPRSLITGTLVQLNEEYAGATARRIAAEQRWNRVRSGSALNVPEVLQNQAVQYLMRQRAELSARIEQESERRRDDFPSIREARAELAELDRQIAAIAGNIRNSIRNEYDIARGNEQSLAARVDQLRTSTFTEQDQSVQLSILRREADTFRQQYEYLLRRFNELNAEAGVQSNNISLIDRATTPIEPSSPSILLNLFLASLGGATLSVLFCFVRHSVFDTVRTPEDVARDLKLPLLGVIPNPETEGNILEELADPKKPISEAFSSLRSAITLLTPHGVPRSIAFISSTASEGKSSACYATGLSLARAGKRVLIIDLDLRRPNQHNQFGVENSAGMSELLSGNATLAEVVRSSRTERLSLISGGAVPPNPTDLLQRENIEAVINEGLTSFDVVLVDSAPVLGLADAVIVGSSVVATLFIVESGKNLPRVILSSLERLAAGRTHVAGVLLTKFDAASAGYGDIYEQYYSYAHARRHES